MPPSPPTTPGSACRRASATPRWWSATARSSEGEPERILNLQLDPYYLAPLGLGPMSTSALQASAYMARSGATDRDLAEIAARNRAAGARNPDAQLREAASADELQRTPWAVEPLREGYVPPIGESAVVPDARRRGQGGEDVQAAGVDPRRRSARRDAEPRRARSDAQRQHRAGRPRRRWRWPASASAARRRRDRDAADQSGRGDDRARGDGARRRQRRHAAGDQSVRRADRRPSADDDRSDPLGEAFRQLSGAADGHAVPNAQARASRMRRRDTACSRIWCSCSGRERRWS